MIEFFISLCEKLLQIRNYGVFLEGNTLTPRGEGRGEDVC